MRLEIVTRGSTLSALAWGRSHDPVVILLHGFPDTAWTWRHLGPVLAQQGWRAVAPFTRGYAPSSLAWDGTYEIGALVADVVALRQRIAAGNTVALVGHDFGGAIVSAVAALAPEKFSSATILAIPPAPVFAGLLRRRPWQLLRTAPRSWHMQFFQIPGLAERIGPSLFDLLWRRWAPGYDSTEDRAALHEALPSLAHRRAVITYYRALVNPLYRRAEYKGQLGRAFGPLGLPTHYLHGIQDTCGSAELGDDALRYLPAGSTRTLVPDAGHFLHLERPQAVNSLITAWLSKHRPRAGQLTPPTLGNVRVDGRNEQQRSPIQ